MAKTKLSVRKGRMRKIALIAGARPNYMKIFPLWRAFKESPVFQPMIIHTGQHYDREMSDFFFDDLGLPAPDVNLGIGSGTHGEQTGKIMIALEPVLKDQGPDMAVVVGDVNSTMAGALVAAKMGIPIAHVEAGLRSFDRSMPEEINRVVTDAVSSLLFTTCRNANDNLLREGISADKIHFAGNIMIDSLAIYLRQASRSKILETLKLDPGRYIVTTLHRPSNVDDPENIRLIFEKLNMLAGFYPVVFPVHPRTKKKIESCGILPKASGLQLISPLGYLDFLRLMSKSALVITDSGGIQEETTFLGIPCLTLRPNTERPITITHGTNKLIDLCRNDISKEALSAIRNRAFRAQKIEKWDGKTAERILKVLGKFFDKGNR